MFLSCNNKTAGVLKNSEVVVKDVNGGSKRFSDEVWYSSRKCVKTFNSFHNEELEVKLKNVSGDMTELREKRLGQEISQRKEMTPQFQ